jgi:hypothetical protein
VSNYMNKVLLDSSIITGWLQDGQAWNRLAMELIFPQEPSLNSKAELIKKLCDALPAYLLKAYCKIIPQLEDLCKADTSQQLKPVLQQIKILKQEMDLQNDTVLAFLDKYTKPHFTLSDVRQDLGNLLEQLASFSQFECVLTDTALLAQLSFKPALEQKEPKHFPKYH